MGNKVPYTRIPGLTDVQQLQLDRDFAEAARQLDEGVGNVIVPYRRIPGLDPETQRQIDRNFSELACDCAGDLDAGTIIASDTFARQATPPGFTDSYAGGTAKLWNQLAGTWESSSTFGAMLYTANGPGGTNAFSEVVIDTGQLNHKIESVLHTSAVVPVGSSSIGVCVRARSHDEYIFAYMFRPNVGVDRLYAGEMVAGVETDYGSTPVNHPGTPVDDTILLEVIGTTVNAYFRGVLYATFTTSMSFTGTGAGLIAQNDLNGAYQLSMIVTAT